MSFGDCDVDAHLRDAWRQFCRRLEEAGDQVFKDSNPALPQHRTDAFRFLTQNLGQAFDLALETKNTQYPVIHAFCTPFCKLGGDNADYTYQQAWIDGHSVYRISGNRGTSRFFNIAVQGHRPESKPDGNGWRNLHEPFGDTPEANLFGHDMEIGWDGSFEVYIGGEKRGPNWLPTKNPVYNVDRDRLRGRSIYAMCWRLEPDEAMIIEWERNDLFWMMTNMGVFMNSMDYLYRPVSYSPARAKADSDGKMRIVMAHKDPGFHNWLDTSGLVQGMVVNRNQGTDQITEFETRVVKQADLDRHMPADSARVAAEERTRLMQLRFRSILHRYLL